MSENANSAGVYRSDSHPACHCGDCRVMKREDCPRHSDLQMKQNRIHPQIKKAIINWMNNNPRDKDKPFTIAKDKKSYTLTELLSEIKNETDSAEKGAEIIFFHNTRNVFP